MPRKTHAVNSACSDCAIEPEFDSGYEEDFKRLRVERKFPNYDEIDEGVLFED